ncbi:MAG: cell division protein ZapA [Muribaculum sp.]|nr:cell division protein ZapA [Muribaculum sp.]
MDKDKEHQIKLDINIAGERIILTSPFSRQEAVRATEKNVNDLFNTWRHDFPNKSDKEILAMMAFQYASFYHELLAIQKEARSLAVMADSKLRDIIQDNPSLT